MYTKTSEIQSNQLRSDSYNSEWREAKRCAPKCTPKPTPSETHCRIERDSTETITINNSIHTGQLTDQRSDEKFSGTMSKLAWLLFGLSSLLFLGSLILLVGSGRSANNVNKETVNNVSRTREVIRTERVSDRDSDLYIIAPRARW